MVRKQVVPIVIKAWPYRAIAPSTHDPVSANRPPRPIRGTANAGVRATRGRRPCSRVCLAQELVTQRRPDSVAYDPPEGTQGGGYRGQAVAPVRMKAAPVPAPDSIRGRLRTGMIAATGACSPRTATTWLPTPDSRKWAAPGSRGDQGASGLTWRHVKKDGGDANKQNPHRRHGSDLAPPPVPLACDRADDRRHCVRRSERDCVDPILG